MAGYQHALAWSPTNPLEIFVGNDSGLWRSMDGIGENWASVRRKRRFAFSKPEYGAGISGRGGELLAGIDSPYTMVAGLGVNGTAGVKNTSGPTASGRKFSGASAVR